MILVICSRFNLMLLAVSFVSASCWITKNIDKVWSDEIMIMTKILTNKRAYGYS